MHRLVAGAHMPGVHACRHRLDALALPRQAQARDVRAQRLMAIPMAKGGGQLVHVGGTLDPIGEPHWLSKQARLLRLIVRRKVGQLRLALRDRPRHLRIVK